MFPCKNYKVRVDIKQWGNHFGENLSALPKVQEFPTSVGCFQEFATNCLNTLAQLAIAKKSFLIYTRMCF